MDEDDFGDAESGSEDGMPSDSSSERVGYNNDASWELVQSKRQKKKLQRQGQRKGTGTGPDAQPHDRKSLGNATGCNKTGEVEQRRPRRRLPPLPKNDIKIIFRPKKGLMVKSLTTHQVARAVIMACGQQCKDEDILVRLRTGSNIIIVSTPHEETAHLVRRITRLKFAGKSYEVNAYVAAPEDVFRGVIHGVDPGTSPEELKAHLRVRTQGVTILQARMLGKSKTAVITFDGPILPKFVIYYGGELPCYQYRPTRQVCYVCFQQGHRSDVCPTPDIIVCGLCGDKNPTKDHVCELKCLICGEAHRTGSKECPERLKKARPKPSGERGRSGQRGRPRKRWFSSEGETSRSRSRSNSFPPLSPAGSQEGNKQEKQKKKLSQKGGSKVSWASTIDPHSVENSNTNNTNNKNIPVKEAKDASSDALRRELELARLKQNELERKVEELTKTLKAQQRELEITRAFPKQPQASNNGELETRMQQMMQQMMQDMMRQIQSQMQQMQAQFQGQISEIKSAFRKQRHNENIRERAYNRPALTAFAVEQGNSTNT